MAAPAAGEPFLCSSQIPAAPFPSVMAAGAQQGLGDAPRCSQASPASWECVQAACPAHSSAGCILNTAHSMTEILPKAAHWQHTALPKGSLCVQIPSLP